MKHLYAPWRSTYVQEENAPKQENADASECIFCACVQSDDAACYILHRGTFWYVMMNRYPYNPGHILVVSYEHIHSPILFSRDAQHELSDLTYAGMKILEAVIQPQGSNVGMNIGKAGGAGIPSHVHQHIVPRWNGDTNFLPVLSETKHISCDLNDLYVTLCAVYKEYYK